MTVFADIFFYLALFNRRDAHHRRVLSFMQGFKSDVVTTQWVLTEVADAFAGISERRFLREKFRVLEEDAGTKTVPVQTELFTRGLWLYDARPDKG